MAPGGPPAALRRQHQPRGRRAAAGGCGAVPDGDGPAVRRRLRPRLAAPQWPVLAVLGEQINAVRADLYADPGEKARILGMLSSVALRAKEAKDLDARLEAVERVLKLRRDAQEANQKRGRRGW